MNASLKYKILLFSIGLTSILSQLLLIREFLNVFEGNELIVGIFFCIWMMLTAAGSFSAAKFKKVSGLPDSGLLLLILSALPFTQVAVLYCSQRLFFPPGSDISFPFIVLIGTAVLFPICFLSGRLFTFAASGFSAASGKNKIALAYAWESAGSIFAGLLFITALPFLLSTFQVAALIVLLNLFLFGFTAFRRSLKFILPVICIFLFVLVALFSEKSLQQIHFRYQQLLKWQNTPYGNISVTNAGEQINFFLNSNPLLLNDPFYYEEPVHFVLAQHSHPKNVLIVAGGLNQVKEVFKYAAVRSADYIEINPHIIDLDQEYSIPVNDKRVKVIIDDPRNFIIHAQKKYDAVIINAPDPSSAQINRYYTREFFAEIKKVLSDEGIMGISLSSSGNYMNDEALQLNGILKITLDREFKNLVVIPGARNYFIASDAPVTPRIISHLNNLGIENTYVNSYYFDDDLLEQRSNELTSQIEGMTFQVNSDLVPIAYFIHIGYVLKRTGSTNFLIIGAVLFASVLAALMLFHKKRIYFRVFSASLGAASGQFLLIFIYQVLFGNMYRMLGILTSFYMAGLVIGSMIRTEKTAKGKLLDLLAPVTLALLLAALGFFAVFATHSTEIPKWIVQMILLLLGTAIAFAFALLFNISTHVNGRHITDISGTLYGVDLAGSAAGIILISLVFLPLFGLSVSSFIVASILVLFTVLFQKRPTA